MEIARADAAYEAVADRLAHYREFAIYPDGAETARQAARCMDCGIPYCQTGCPVHNIIPDWNDLVYRGDWRRAIDTLHSTNNFPEFTGRVCPAPCEESCTLNFNDSAVAIKSIERGIVDYAWSQNWIVPQPAAARSGRRVAVVGSGPSGLACAQQLARAGHAVTVYEKNERPGGLLRYGIPDFKMEKGLIDRRVAQMEAEGVEFRTGVYVGGGGDGVDARALAAEYDAVVLAGGSEHPRDLPIAGRQLRGVHFAMEFLPQQNRRNAGLPVRADDILATGKHVIVIGGGDTGSDCIGTSNRQGAKSITQFELLPQPPASENKFLTWPHWPVKLRTSTSHIEGCDRRWSIQTKAFVGDGRVERIRMVKLQWDCDDSGRMRMAEIPDSAFELPADLVLLAMGYVHPVHRGMIESLGVARDERGNVRATTADYRASPVSAVSGTAVSSTAGAVAGNIFAAGDMRRGQSLVVWAIREGRQCARAVDHYLTHASTLPRA